MFNTLKQILIVISFIATAGIAIANDTAGTTAGGGINFVQMQGISIEREQLTISPTDIKVSYLFRNNTDKDITTQLFFPLPAFTLKNANAIWDPEVAAVSGKTAPFLNFKVSVQGQDTPYSTDVRAVMNGQNITQNLKQAGIPINPVLAAGKLPLPQSAASKVTQWQQQAKQLGLLDDAGNPKWQKQVTFYWTQTFPAHQLLLIEHEYRPATGMFYVPVIPNQASNTAVQQSLQRAQTLFGVDPEKLIAGNQLNSWLTQQIQQNPQGSNGVYAHFYNVDYILSTAANWDGAIKDFTLNLMKPSNGIVAYNKFYDKQKAAVIDNSKQLQVYIQNFKPTQELKVLFVSNSSLLN